MHLVGLVAALVLMFGTAGCSDPQAEDKAAIRQTLLAYDAANRERNGKAVVELMSPGTLEFYTKLVRVALDGSEAESRALPAHYRMELIRMRTLATRKDLKGMDGKAFQSWATTQGWYAMDTDGWASLTRGASDIKIDLDGKGAWCYIFEDGKRTSFMLRFEKVGDQWRFDETSASDHFDDWTKKWARDERMTQDELLVEMVSEELGVEIDSKAIWRPMKK
jgi:hypothetical protein